MGLLGHLKDENNLAQKDVMTCLGNTDQFSTGGKLLTIPDLDISPGGLLRFYTTPVIMVVLRGEYLVSTCQAACRNTYPYL